MWTQSEYQYTNSQTNGWLEQEEALLDQMTFEHQPPNAYTMESRKSPITTDVDFNCYPTNITSPAPPAPDSNHHLRSVMEIPKEYQSIFKYAQFNRMQSEAMNQLLCSDENTVVSAPTGTGKTALLEMAMIRCLSIHQTQQNYQQGSIKMIYMAPTKSLCAEKVAHWKNTFGPLGIVCEEFTGDSDYASMDSIKNSSIIVTTPEKWDSMTRKWVDHRRLAELIKLMMIDEIHILKETRGATLEVCVSRMKAMDHDLRIVAVSATIPNLQDITTWLNATALTFSEEYRPIHLKRYVYGYPSRGTNSYAFEKSLDWKLLDIIVKHGDDKPVLIFCSTRTATQSACDTILKLMERKNIASKLPNNNVELKNKKLYGLIQHGIGFHHAGLDSGDRRTVEQMFLNRQIGIVATTSTLAVGVNLPAHLVIIKSTKGYQNGGLEEYSDIDILQMIGRAGRPGLDTSGCAVIMTTTDMEHKFISLVSCQSIIESSLHRNLTEHLMSEICIGTVADVESSIKWLGSTFLCTRVKKNPSYYQQLYSGESLAKNPDQVMQDICLKDMKLLIDHKLVSVSGDDHNAKHEPTFYGSTMNRYYIQFKTMVKIMQSGNWSSIKDVLELVSQSEEFETYRYNAHEKPILNDLRSNSDIRFPLKNKVSDVSDKVNILIQCVLGDISLYHSLVGNSLTTTTHAILQKACRITKCIIDCAAHEKNAVKLKHALDLYRCMNAKMWSTSPFILKQLDGIGIQMAKNLSQKNVFSFEQLRDCDPGRLEMILHRNPPFGTKIHNALSFLPHYYLELKQKPKQRYQNQPTIALSVCVGLTTLPKGGSQKFGKGFFTVLWIETSDHTLVDFRRIRTENLTKRHSELNFLVQVTSPSMMVVCHVQSEDYVGLDVMKKLKPNVDPTQFITLTDPMTRVTTAAPLTQQTTNATVPIMKPIENDTSAFLDTGIDSVEEFDDSKTIKVEPPSPLLEKKSTRSKKNDNEPCKHHCKDKQSCKHQCCKRGIPPNENRITSYSDFGFLPNNVSTPFDNDRISTSPTTGNSDNNGTYTMTPTPPIPLTSHQPSATSTYSPHLTTAESSWKEHLSSYHDDDDDYIDLTRLSPLLDLDSSLSTMEIVSDDDLDDWDITDKSMNELLCNMTIKAEKNQYGHLTGNTDMEMDGDDHDDDIESFAVMPSQDYQLLTPVTATTVPTATNKQISCDWIWAYLGQNIYDTEKTLNGCGGGDDDDDAAIAMDLDDDVFEIGSPMTRKDAQNLNQGNAPRIPNLIKWLQDQELVD